MFIASTANAHTSTLVSTLPKGFVRATHLHRRGSRFDTHDIQN